MKRNDVADIAWGLGFVVMSWLAFASSPVSLHSLDALAVMIWLIGFFFESVGDRQLRDFLKDPRNKGKVMDLGLWAYSRHPNYFGEVLQ